MCIYISSNSDDCAVYMSYAHDFAICISNTWIQHLSIHQYIFYLYIIGFRRLCCVYMSYTHDSAICISNTSIQHVSIHQYIIFLHIIEFRWLWSLYVVCTWLCYLYIKYMNISSMYISSNSHNSTPPKNGLIALQTPRTSRTPLFTVAR